MGSDREVGGHEPIVRDVPFAITEDGVLMCPGCFGVHTHVDHVAIANASGTGKVLHASGEDARSKVVVREVTQPDKGRRHSVLLNGDCEECGKSFLVILHQHKGLTYVDTFANMPGPEHG